MRVDEIILQAKIGDKQAFLKIWEAHKPLLKRIFNEFKSIYPFLYSYYGEVFQDLYVCCWEEINKFDFEDDLTLSYRIKDRSISHICEVLEKRHMVPKESIVKRRTFNKLLTIIPSDEIFDRRMLAWRLIQISTPKQREVLFLKYYARCPGGEIHSALGLTPEGYHVRIVDLFKKIAISIYGIVRVKGKKPEIREKIYKIYEVNPLEIKTWASNEWNG